MEIIINNKGNLKFVHKGHMCTNKYSKKMDEDVKLFCGMTDGLTFLPENGVPDGMAYVDDNIPNGLESLLQYSDGIYVSGIYRQIQLSQRPDDTIPPLHMCRKTPMYPPSISPFRADPELTTYVRVGIVPSLSW